MEKNKTIVEQVDELYAASDLAIHALYTRIYDQIIKDSEGPTGVEPSNLQ